MATKLWNLPEPFCCHLPQAGKGLFVSSGIPTCVLYLINVFVFPFGCNSFNKRGLVLIVFRKHDFVHGGLDKGEKWSMNVNEYTSFFEIH